MGIYDRTTNEVEYTGWVKLDHLRRITTYGNMKGIRFSFAGAKKDRYFGYCDENKGYSVQEIDYEGGERIVGIVVLVEDEDASSDVGKVELGAEAVECILSDGGPYPPLEKIFFLTDRNKKNFSLPVKYHVSCPYLTAVKFDFNYHRLISWAPIYTPDTDIPDSFKIVAEMVQYPWKCRTDVITPDGEITPTSRVACVFFDDEGGQRVDGVKGYVSKSGHFCGLVFRRNGNWCDNIFGHRSAYEVIMELGEGEKFTSLYLPSENTEALAVYFKPLYLTYIGSY